LRIRDLKHFRNHEQKMWADFTKYKFLWINRNQSIGRKTNTACRQKDRSLYLVYVWCEL